jgi:hypothetical protein
MSRFLLLLVPIVVACDQQTQTALDDTAASTSPPSTSTADPGLPFVVEADGEQATVGLGTIDLVTVAGDRVVPLADVLQASGLPVTWEDRTYDFLASDDFQPSQRGCEPLGWTELEGGYAYPETGNLTWDEALGLPGCYFVNEVVTILVLP